MKKYVVFCLAVIALLMGSCKNEDISISREVTFDVNLMRSLVVSSLTNTLQVTWNRCRQVGSCVFMFWCMTRRVIWLIPKSATLMTIIQP